MRARAIVRFEVDADVIERARAFRPELVVSWFFSRKIPRAIRELAPAIGVHPSLLPRWRGPDPYFWTIVSGDERTGVTAHTLDDGYDTGAILGQRELRVEPTWDAWTLARALDRPSLALLREVARAYARGEPPRAVPQDEARVTLAPEPEDLEIRWSEPAHAIERFIRAAAPWPGAFTEIRGATVVLTRARVVRAPASLAPGEALVREGVAVVRAKDGGVALLAGRLEDGERPLDARALAELLSM